MKSHCAVIFTYLVFLVLVTAYTDPRQANRVRAAQFHHRLSHAVNQGTLTAVGSLVAPRLAYFTCIGQRRDRLEFKQRSDYLRDIMAWGTGRIVSVENPFQGVTYFEVSINGRVFQYAVTNTDMILHSVRERGC